MRKIRSKYLLRPQAHARLKAEIISSPGNYQAETVKPLLEKLSENGRNELARMARETLKNVKTGETWIYFIFFQKNPRLL